MTAVAKKNPVKLPQFQERRMQLPDVMQKGVWLVGELKERFKSTEGEMINWMRSITVTPGNEFMFIRTDHAIALAHCLREPLSSRPIVQEQFVLVEDEKYMEEGGYLYECLKRWALNLQAYQLRVENFTNVPRQMVKERLGDLYEIPMTYCKL